MADELCSICTDVITSGHWHNAMPVASEWACGTCNDNYVIPSRIQHTKYYGYREGWDTNER